MKNKAYIVTIGDIHFGASDDKHLYDELKSQFIPFIKEKIDEDKLDIISFAGDLYHRVINFNEDGGRLVLQFMEEVLIIDKEANVSVNIIRGTKSHDYAQLNMLKHFEADYPNFTIINTATILDVPTRNGKDKIHTLFLPEEYPTNIDNFYKNFTGEEIPDNSYDIIIGHGMMDYVFNLDYKSNFEMDIRSAPTWKADNLIRLSKGPVEFGHVHNQEIYKDTVYYTRSFSRFTFADKGTKGFLYTTLEPKDENTNTFNIEEVINEDAPTYVTINIDDLHFDSDEETLKFINDTKEQYDHVRVISSDKSEARLLKQVTENDSTIKISIKDKKLETREIDPELSYLIEGKGSTEENILRYIKNNMGEEHSGSKITIDTIRDIINPKKQSTNQEILETLEK